MNHRTHVQSTRCQLGVRDSCLRITALAVLGAAAPAAAQPGPDEILSQYDAITTLSLDLAVTIHMYEEEDVCEQVVSSVEIAGIMKYFADGPKVRLDSQVDQELYPGLDTAVAFDGQQFQYLVRDRSILSVETATGVPTDEAMMTLPNPFFEIIQHFSPVTSANPGAPVQWGAIKAIAASATMQNATWSPITVDGRELERAILPGGTNEGDSYVHHVYVRPSQRGRPNQIDRVSDEGTLLTRSTFDNYATVAVGQSQQFWPHSMRFELRHAATGAVTAEMSMVIKEIHLNDVTQLPGGVFSIDWSEADTVIVDGVVVQSP